MNEADTAALVGMWAEAWNDCDVEAILALVHRDFRMDRMKGDTIDRDGLAEAVSRQTYGSAMKIFPVRLFGRGDNFAVAARIDFRHVEDDELIGSIEDGGMAGELRDGLVVYAAPQMSSADALAKAQVTESDQIFEWKGEGA
jgi:hypothetical protein